MQMKRFREATGTFAEPSAIAGRERVDGGNMLPIYIFYHCNLMVDI